MMFCPRQKPNDNKELFYHVTIHHLFAGGLYKIRIGAALMFQHHLLHFILVKSVYTASS